MIMPRKLYIPTSTLNFNNIFSSESISPFSFYIKRGYGFHRFEKVLPNNLNNIILLYEKFPNYVVNDKEIENYSMVIEIDIDYCPAKITKIANGIYSCSETIYLNPFNTCVYFNNYIEFNSTKIKAEPSIETKFVNLYNGCYRIVNSSVVKENYKYNLIEDTEINEDALNNDIRINKLKGFAYSYVLAANRSCSPSVVNLKKHFRELENILSAIITAPNFECVQLETNEVKSLYNYIRRDIESIEGIKDRINQIIKSKVDSYQVPNLIEIIQKEELYESWYIKIKNKNGLKIKNDISPFYLNGKTNVLSALDAYSRYLDNYLLDNCRQSELLSNDKMPKFSNLSIEYIPEQTFFLTELLNMYCNEMIQKNMFLSNRYGYALKGGAMFKEACGNKWDNSETRKYINSLLTNLNEYTAFEINSVNNHTLKSFAAFFQKGDIEIEKLENYLIANSIGDFKIAFALWGVVFGFAEMPKTFTRDLFDSDDFVYKSNVYKYIYKSLHGIDLLGELQKSQIPIPTKKIKEEESNISTELTQTKNKSWLKKGFEALKDRMRINTSSDEYSAVFLEQFKPVFNSENFRILKPKAQIWYKDESQKIWLIYHEITVECYKEILALKDVCPISGTKGLWNKCLIPIKPSIKNKKSNKNKIKEIGLFSSLETYNNLQNESDYGVSFIRSLQCASRFSELQLKRLEQNWEYTRNKYENDSIEHLNYFIRLCKKEGRGESKIKTELCQIFTEEIALVMSEEIKKRILLMRSKQY